MLALVFALALSSSPDISRQQVPVQARPDPRGEPVGDVEITGDDRQVFCIRSERSQSRINRTPWCRTQGEWRIIAANRADDITMILNPRHRRYVMDSQLVEESLAQARLNDQRARERAAANR